MSDLGQIFRDAIADLGMTDEGFARKLNVSKRTVRKLMRGEADAVEMLEAWHLMPVTLKLRLMPYISRAIDAWGAEFRREVR